MPTFTMQRKQKVIKIRPRMMIGGGITGSGCWLSAAVLNKKRAGGRHCIRQGGEGGESGWGYGSGLFTAVRIARPPHPPSITLMRLKTLLSVHLWQKRKRRRAESQKIRVFKNNLGFKFQWETLIYWFVFCN